MARKPRVDLGGYTYHITQRGNNREACFFADMDYRFYLECIGKSSEKYSVAIHAYVLMTNHVHLLVTIKRGQSKFTLTPETRSPPGEDCECNS